MKIYICPKAKKEIKELSKKEKRQDVKRLIEDHIQQALKIIKNPPPDGYPNWIVCLKITDEWNFYKLRMSLPGKGKRGSIRLYLVCKDDLTLLLVFHCKKHREQYLMKDIIKFLKDCVTSLDDEE